MTTSTAAHAMAASFTTMVTQRAELGVRQVNTICGYVSLGGVTQTLTCPAAVPCVTYSATYPALAYCSNPGAIPISTAYGYGFWPDYECNLYPTAGYECCPDTFPNPGYYYWNGGATIGAACLPYGTTSLDAVTALQAAVDSTSPPSTAPTTADPPSSTPSPNSPPSNESSGLSNAAKIATIAGSVIAFFALIVTYLGLKSKKDKTTWGQTVANTATMITCCNFGGGGNQSQRNDRNRQHQQGGHDQQQEQPLVQNGRNNNNPPPYYQPSYPSRHSQSYHMSSVRNSRY